MRGAAEEDHLHTAIDTQNGDKFTLCFFFLSLLSSLSFLSSVCFVLSFVFIILVSLFLFRFFLLLSAFFLVLSSVLILLSSFSRLLSSLVSLSSFCLPLINYFGNLDTSKWCIQRFVTNDPFFGGVVKILRESGSVAYEKSDSIVKSLC